jgi:hypothetical protein
VPLLRTSYFTKSHLAAALITEPVKNDFVVFEGETLWHQRLEVARAAVDFEDTLALGALEVVVVLLAGHLVSSRGVGQVDRCKPALLDAELERAVDGRQAESFDFGGGEDFVGVQGSAGIFDRFADGTALACAAWGHVGIIEKA